MHLLFRAASRDDVPAIVGLLADDALGATREQATDPLPDSYYTAFEAIDRDPNNELLVAVSTDSGRIVGTLQLTYTPSLSYRGGSRATIESVRTASDLRGQGIGGKLVSWAVDRARQHGCRLVQLSTDKTRADAQRFYTRLGFVASHEGMKLKLEQSE